MKRTAIILSFLFSFFHCFAQAPQFRAGQADLHAGIGFVSMLYESNNLSTVSFKRPELNLSGSYGVTDEISVGGYLASVTGASSYTATGYQSNGGDVYHTIFGATGQYHYGIVAPLDTYAGGMIGYDLVSLPSSSPTTSQKSGFAYTVYVGAKYQLTPVVGTFAELGYGIALVTVGVNVRLPI